MIEKVARAICSAELMNEDDVLGGWKHWTEAAEAALEAAGVGELIARLIGAGHALRSYQYENTSTEFAKEQADAIDIILAKIGAGP